jgi:hypothetical protein
MRLISLIVLALLILLVWHLRWPYWGYALAVLSLWLVVRWWAARRRRYFAVGRREG